MAKHFAEVPLDTHSLFADDNANSRSKSFQDKFNAHLSKQIKIIIIDRVDLSSVDECPNLTPIEATRAKRELLEIREGFWQTQLRTLERYGGLNKKDERKLTNNRLANKFKKNVWSSTQPNPQNSINLPQPSIIQFDGPTSTAPPATSAINLVTQVLPQSAPNPDTNPYMK